MSAATYPKAAGGRSQRGSVVVELALVLTFAIPLIFAPIVIARSLLHANVAQRAVGNTARMVATFPVFQRRGADVDFEEDAQAMLNAAMRQSGVVARDWEIGDMLEVNCEIPRSVNCKGTPIPELLNVNVEIALLDPTSDFWAIRDALPPGQYLVFDRYAYASGLP